MSHAHDCDSFPPDSLHQRIGHGARCDCLLLAAAAHGGADAVTFSYCRRVLQKRYVMTCGHGEAVPAAEVKETSDKWHDFGEIDAVKAILVTNS